MNLCYLQAAEDGEQVVECHDVAVDRQEAEHPGGADEEQQEEGHSQCRTEEAKMHMDQHFISMFLCCPI